MNVESKKDSIKEYHRETARLLLEAIRKSKVGTEPLITYGEIAAQTKRNAHTQVHFDIGFLSKICVKELNLPMISVIVVRGDKSKFPGPGLFSYWKELYPEEKMSALDKFTSEQEKEIFNLEIDRVKRCKDWWKLEQYLGLKNDIFPKIYKKTIKVSSENIGENYNFSYYDTDLQDISMSKQKRVDRTNRHQHLVRLLASTLEGMDFKLYEGIMDCAAVNREHDAFLVEVKTLSEDGSDEIHQMRLALSQILYYQEFYMAQIPNIISSHPIKKFILFERKISDKHINFLEKYDCYTLWKSDNDTITGTEAVRSLFYKMKKTEY
jgi:hypothetical protein